MLKNHTYLQFNIDTSYWLPTAYVWWGESAFVSGGIFTALS